MPLAVSSRRDGVLDDIGPTAGVVIGGVAGASCGVSALLSIVLLLLVSTAGFKKSYSPISSAKARTPELRPSRNMARTGVI